LSEEEDWAREVPIVEEDFAALLTKFKVRPDLAANIAENISRPGGLRVFEDPEILLKRLTMWSIDIPPARRKNIMDQWFAERGVDIPFEVQQKAGMTTEQIQETEKKTREAEKDEKARTESPFMQDSEGNRVLNHAARVTGVDTREKARL